MKYISTRVIRDVCNVYLVQGQSYRTYNWETLACYPITQKAIAEIDAKNKAMKFSKKVSGLVTAYNCCGYSMTGYINGEEYKK